MSSIILSNAVCTLQNHVQRDPRPIFGVDSLYSTVPFPFPFPVPDNKLFTN